MVLSTLVPLLLAPVWFFSSPFVTGPYHKLSEEEFASLPPINHFDRFSQCVGKEGGVYCTAHAGLVAEQPNQIYDLAYNYSTHSQRHYNYTQLIYGLCMSGSCQEFYSGDSPERLRAGAEACLNRTLDRGYRLKARVSHVNCYRHNEQRRNTVDGLDTFVLYTLIGLIVLGVVGTLYDCLFAEDDEGFLISFSLRANWNRLKAPPPTEPRKAQLIGLNGIRVMTTVLVMLGHAPIPPFTTTENPQNIEWAFTHPLLQVLFQGHTITLTFFLMSGFLLTYNVHLMSETNTITWTALPKVIFIRWLRLLPVNLVVVAITVTWFRFVPFGPMWQENVGVEVEDCRRYWLPNLLYYNNYVDHSTCNLQNWSMAADMHLHILGLALVILSPSARVRRRLLAALLLVGLALPAIETYARDLDPTFLTTGKSIRTARPFLSDPTFNNTYKRSHTNIPCFAMGMILGDLVYSWQVTGVDRNSRGYKIFKMLYWSSTVILLSSTMSTFLLFLGDVPRAPLYQRVLFAVFQKPMFGFGIALIIAGLALQVEKEAIPVYSRILTWPVWTPLSRMTYSMFMVHVLVVRVLGGPQTTLTFTTVIHILQNFIGVVIISTVAGLVMWLFVEAPFTQLVKKAFYPAKKVDDKVANGKVGNGNTANGHFEINGNTIKANGKYE